MIDLIPKLVPLKGIFNAEIGAVSLCDCSFSRDHITGIPLLKFSIAIANVGDGPLHIVLGDIQNEDGRQVAPAKQLIYDEHQTPKEVDVGFFELHIDEEHHHRHWHYEGLASLDLVNEDDSVVASSKKDGYCVIDYFRYLSSPKSPERPRFSPTACEGQKSEVGISLGWADCYDDSSIDQAIELSEVESGNYWLRFKINRTKMVYDYAEPARLALMIDKENKSLKITDTGC